MWCLSASLPFLLFSREKSLNFIISIQSSPRNFKLKRKWSHGFNCNVLKRSASLILTCNCSLISNPNFVFLNFRCGFAWVRLSIFQPEENNHHTMSFLFSWVLELWWIFISRPEPQNSRRYRFGSAPMHFSVKFKKIRRIFKLMPGNEWILELLVKHFIWPEINRC